MLVLRLILTASAVALLVHITSAAHAADAPGVARGRYLVKTAGCNDCHTAGYAASGGKVPEAQWLTGDSLGWRGGWGTTYPRNLRRFMAGLTEDQWVHVARTAQFRPPMPWFALRDMDDGDLRSIYRFVRTLRPLGDQAPEYLPPGVAPKGPVIAFPDGAQ